MKKLVKTILLAAIAIVAVNVNINAAAFSVNSLDDTADATAGDGI